MSFRHCPLKDNQLWITDYLDQYSEEILGHTNWKFAEYDRTRLSSILENPEVHSVVIFYNEAEEKEDL